MRSGTVHTDSVGHLEDTILIHSDFLLFFGKQSVTIPSGPSQLGNVLFQLDK